jgi:hypothetical protein
MVSYAALPPHFNLDFKLNSPSQHVAVHFVHEGRLDKVLQVLAVAELRQLGVELGTHQHCALQRGVHLWYMHTAACATIRLW